MAGSSVAVFRNDALKLDGIRHMNPSHIVISPGPGAPADARLSNDVIRALAQEVPILGVCLGHQCLAWCFGASVIPSPVPTHGKTSAIHHDEKGVFRNLPNPFRGTRYHSLTVEAASIPDCFDISAKTSEGEVMGIRLKNSSTEGVQFHPESVLSEGGMQMIRNFLTG